MRKYLHNLKIVFILILIFFDRQRSSAQTLPYLQVDVIKTSGQTTDSQIDALTVAQKQTTLTYFDGLGNVLQTVAKQASPTQKDMIQPILYDNLGRQTINYLPYSGTTTNGGFHNNAIAEQNTFYNTAQDKIADDASPYSQQVFENSPLQRVLQAGMVGNGYQPTVSGNHFKSVNYRQNTQAVDGYIINWGPDGSNLGSYDELALNVTETVDEDGVTSRSFTDIEGRIILKRQKAGVNANYDTYYVYNNAGALHFIIPPKAVSIMISANNFNLAQIGVNKLVFTYLYDYKGRVVEKTVPSSGTVFIVYDPLDRPVLMQDGNLRNSNQWNYIKYDVKGRVVSQGIYTDATYTTRASMQAHVSNDLNAAYNTTWFESRINNSSAGYYSNNVFPTAGINPLAYSYYDDYDLNQDGSADYAYTTAGITGESQQTSLTRGLATIVRTRTIGSGLSDIWLTKAMFYDKNYHLIQVRSNNQLNYTADVLTDAQTNVVDFVGKVTNTKTVKVTSGTIAIQTNMAYDHMYRVNAISQQYNGGASVSVASYEYNELGQLVKKNLAPGGNTSIPSTINLDGSNSVASGSTASYVASSSISFSPGFQAASGSIFSASISLTSLQAVDYRYNIKGQLTSINNSKLADDGGVTNNDSNDLFGLTLLYDYADPNLGNTASFNGNVSAVQWMSKNGSNSATNERSYKYSYDQLNRYTQSAYAERAGGNTGAFNINTGGFDEGGISYDENSNITALQRNSSSPGAGGGTQGDNLTYSYDANNPNQLSTVTDGSGANYTGFGFRNITGSAGAYAYDGNSGNLTADPYKGLALNYNVLNKTNTITVTTSSGRHLDYTYSAAGQLIRKQQYDGGTVQATTDYIDGYTYINGTLSYTAMPEGRLLNLSGTLKAEYIITDQQGNARVSLQDNGSGVAVVKQENSYYGFGMVMPNSPVSMPTTPNKQLYNGGSEWQNDYSNLPDYYQTFYRNYDAAIGRFNSVDPLAGGSESLSVYQYGMNNPIMMNDPMGDQQQPNTTAVYLSDYMLDYSATASGGYNAADWNNFGLNTMGTELTRSLILYSRGTGNNNVLAALPQLMGATYGGNANASGTTIFNSDNTAFNAGVAYLNFTSGWGNGTAQDYRSAAFAFNSNAHKGGNVNSDIASRIFENKTTWYHNGDGSPNQIDGNSASTEIIDGMGLFGVADALDKSLNLTTDMVIGSQAIAGIGWKQMLREIPLLKQLGTATGFVGLYQHGKNFIKTPNWKDGLEFGGQASILVLKFAFPESYIIDAVEFGYNNGTMVFDTIWDHNHK